MHIRALGALGAVTVVGAAAALAIAVIRPAAAGAGAPLLPDLEQETPSNLVVTYGRRHGHRYYVLGFRSAAHNIGDGPLIIDGHRHDRGIDTMAADQVVVRDGAPRQVVRGIGRLRYVVSPDHRHWHLLRFERYELHRAGHRLPRAKDHKTGFCLGDRYAVSDQVLPARAPSPAYTSRCGLAQPQLLGVREGISVGYGDDYGATLEGQYVVLSGLPSGRYVLVHRVNASRRIREKRYDNDAASVLLRLRWRRGVPFLRVLAKCPDSARCA